MRFASSGAFTAMGIPLLEGRDFEPQDNRHAGIVRGIINRSFADRHFVDTSAVGEFVTVGGSQIEIIGVVGDVRQARLDEQIMNVVYVTLAQVTRTGMTLVVRTDGAPKAQLPSIQAAIWDINPDQPIERVTTLDALVSESVSSRRHSALLVGLFAGLALFRGGTGRRRCSRESRPGPARRRSRPGAVAALGLSPPPPAPWTSGPQYRGP